MKHKILYGKRAQGRKEFLLVQDNKKVTRNGAIKAFCYECMGGYQDGVIDCENKYCPLYQYHPYREE